MDGPVGLNKISSQCSIPEMDDFDPLSRLLDKPRLNIERQRSFDESSLSELSQGFARAGLDNYENYSPGVRSGFNTPSSARNSFEPHPMVADAWECLRKSLDPWITSMLALYLWSIAADILKWKPRIGHEVCGNKACWNIWIPCP